MWVCGEPAEGWDRSMQESVSQGSESPSQPLPCPSRDEHCWTLLGYSKIPTPTPWRTWERCSLSCRCRDVTCGHRWSCTPGVANVSIRGCWAWRTDTAHEGSTFRPSLQACIGHTSGRQACARQPTSHRFKLLSHEGVVITLASHQIWPTGVTGI